MGNGQATGFLGVIDEVPLGVPRRGVPDDFDVVFGRGDAAVTAQTIEQRLEFGGRGQGVFRQSQGQIRHIIINADGKARLGLRFTELVEDRQHAVRSELFGGQTVTPPDHARQRFTFAMIKGLGQGGHHIQIQRFRLRARLFGAIEHRNGTRAFRQRREEMFRRERPIETHFQHANFFAARQQLINNFLAGANGRSHQHNDPFRLRMAVILKGFVFPTRCGSKVIHRLFNMVVNRVVPRVGGLA